MTRYINSIELASHIKNIIKELILDFNLDIDHGVDIILYSPDIDKEVFKEVLNNIMDDIKIVYVHMYIEPGFYIKKIFWRGYQIIIGVRPAIL